jgi:hypothetical protein
LESVWTQSRYVSFILRRATSMIISPEHFDGDFDDSELTEEDLEIIKP